jgi:SAM-dependent methyltransferase
MLIPGAPQTIGLADQSLRRARQELVDDRAPDLHLESLGISAEEKEGVLQMARQGSAIDPVVAHLVAATNGLMYRHLIGSLDRYPIPDLPLPAGDGHSLLDVGCSWGRWTLAATARGYKAVGLDPSLGAVMAARRVARSVGAQCRFVVGDARYLPFPDGWFDNVYSYSVIQHFSREDAALAVAEAGRILKPGGTAKVQMPTRYGIRCLLHQLRRGFREGQGFEVRYWSLPELRRMFRTSVGPTRIEADCYFGIGLQRSDAALMTPLLAAILGASEALKALSRHVGALVWFADSVFAEANKPQRTMK